MFRSLWQFLSGGVPNLQAQMIFEDFSDVAVLSQIESHQGMLVVLLRLGCRADSFRTYLTYVCFKQSIGVLCDCFMKEQKLINGGYSTRNEPSEFNHNLCVE